MVPSFHLSVKINLKNMYSVVFKWFAAQNLLTSQLTEMRGVNSKFFNLIGISR